jgi:hypothetical protein
MFNIRSSVEAADYVWEQQHGGDDCDKELHGFSPHANYTNRATAACLRS